MITARNYEPSFGMPVYCQALLDVLSSVHHRESQAGLT